PLYFHHRPWTIGSSCAPRTLASDDPDEAQPRIPLRVTGVIPPNHSVEPDSLTADLFTGQSTMRTVTLHNGGGSDLVFEIAVESAGPDERTLHAAPGGLPATPAIAPGAPVPLERLSCRVAVTPEPAAA